MKDECGNEIEPLSKEELERISPPEKKVWRKGPYRMEKWLPAYTKILVMVQKGISIADIARSGEVPYGKQHIWQITSTPQFKMKLAKFSERADSVIMEKAAQEMAKTPEIVLAKEKLAASAEIAADILVQLMDPKSKLSKEKSINDRRLMMTAAQDVLDRAGLKNVIPQEDPNRGREYSPEEVKSALENARELESITNRLGSGQSGYVLTREQRNGNEETIDMAPTDATEPEGVPLKTNATEETTAFEEEGNPQ